MTKKLASKQKRIIGFDTETVNVKGVQKFYSFQLFSPELKLNCISFDKDALRHLFTDGTKNTIIVAANAEFDLSVLGQVIDTKRFTTEMIYTTSKFIRAEVRDKWTGIWHIIDIFNIFPKYSVDKLGKLLKIPKLEKPEYLGKRAPTEEEKPYFIKYAMRDAEIAYYAARMVCDEFGRIKPTLPSLCLTLYNRYNRDVRFWKQPEEEKHNKILLSYNGARVESFGRGTYYDKMFAYDFRSLYPSIMVNGLFPDIRGTALYKNDIDLDKEGFALCTISQDAHLPPLCFHYNLKDIGNRLVFPNGKIKAWFTYAELNYLEMFNYGKILKVHEAIQFENTFNPFTEYTTAMFDKRAYYLEQKDERAEMYKLMLNAHYGKYGQHLDSYIYKFTNGKMEKVKTKSSFGKNTHYAIASYVTAQGRIKLHKEMMRNKGLDICYCDTDGFLSTKSNYPTVDKLGGLTNRTGDNEISITTLLRAKMYIANDKVVFKGLFTNVSGYAMRNHILNDNMKFSKQTFLKPRQAAKMHLEPLTDFKKVVNFSLKPDGKRSYIKNLQRKELITEFTQSEPLVLHEID